MNHEDFAKMETRKVFTEADIDALNALNEFCGRNGLDWQLEVNHDPHEISFKAREHQIWGSPTVPATVESNTNREYSSIAYLAEGVLSEDDFGAAEFFPCRSRFKFPERGVDLTFEIEEVIEP